MRRILGIDPGLASTGWGIIQTDGNRYTYISHGVIETVASMPHGQRLLFIYNSLQAIIDEYRPDEAGMETLYFVKNITSGIAVAEARGVVTLVLCQNCIKLGEYTPLVIKKAVTGTASADKNVVQQSVKILLGLNEIVKPDHASDALAAAITHINNISVNMFTK
jgi:crossover junction endodeoxyribonuclease RuvC